MKLTFGDTNRESRTYENVANVDRTEAGELIIDFVEDGEHKRAQLPIGYSLLSATMETDD